MQTRFNRSKFHVQVDSFKSPLARAAFKHLTGFPKLLSGFQALRQTTPLAMQLFHKPGKPSEELQAKVRQQIFEAVAPGLAKANGRSNSVLDAAKAAVIAGIEAAWQEALIAALAAPGGAPAKALVFLETLMIKGASIAIETFWKKLREQAPAAPEPMPTAATAPGKPLVVISTPHQQVHRGQADQGVLFGFEDGAAA
jgi:hypothetical protein